MPLDTTTELVENLVRLRGVENHASQAQLPALIAVRNSLRDLVGPTVRPATAARLLGISQPALRRWTSQGEIPTVVTPQGRREIPVIELVGLLEEVDQLRAEGAGRPVARAIHERNRRAVSEVDIDELLPPRRLRGHRVAELHSLAYHRLVARRLDESMLETARQRLAAQRARGQIHPTWADRWERVLGEPLNKVAAVISADKPSARQLRQTSPFAGMLTEQERRRLVRAVEQRGNA